MGSLLLQVLYRRLYRLHLDEHRRDRLGQRLRKAEMHVVLKLGDTAARGLRRVLDGLL